LIPDHLPPAQRNPIGQPTTGSVNRLGSAAIQYILSSAFHRSS